MERRLGFSSLKVLQLDAVGRSFCKRLNPSLLESTQELEAKRAGVVPGFRFFMTQLPTLHVMALLICQTCHTAIPLLGNV